MADRWWVGAANDGDWGNVNNWATARYGAGGASVPTTGDAVYIWDTAQAIYQSLSQGSVDLLSLDVRFAGVIGTNSTALTIAVSGGGNLVYAGSGAFCNIAAGTNGIDLCHVISTGIPGGGRGAFRLAGGTSLTLYVGANADVVVEAAAVLSTELACAGGNVDVAYNATGIGVCSSGGGGRITCDRAIGTAIISKDATLRMRRAAGLGTSCLVMGGGRLEHMSSGTIAAISVLPDGVATTNGNQTLATVTNSVKYEGGNLFDNEPGITFSNAPAVIGATR